MSITYNIVNANDCFLNMATFLANCGISFITDTPTLKIFKDFSNSVYVQMYLDSNNNRVVLFASEDYNSSSSYWFQQQKSPMYGSSYLGMALPAVSGGSLICNYNDTTVLFSVIGTTVARNTYLLGFGVIDEIHSSWEGGFYMIGNREVSIRSNSITYLGSQDDLRLLLRINDDYATADVRGKLYWAGNYISRRDWNVYENWTAGEVVRYNGKVYVCTTSFVGDNTKFDVYYNMGYFELLCLDNEIDRLMAVQSIVGSEIDYQLPTYANFFIGDDIIYRGSTNQLNCIALCVPLYFYIIRDPQQLKQFSCVGKSNIINYVSMFDMASGREIQSDYPVKQGVFQCFTIGKRRSTGYDLKGGYAGIAFRQP